VFQIVVQIVSEYFFKTVFQIVSGGEEGAER
jgi:hypothetical protein